MKPELEGVLPVWKPKGFTSHDVVAKVRGITRNKRIGHTGTLDPQVTGVLPLCIGRATRLVEYIQELPKEYEARMIIGLATDTEDMTGTVISEVDRADVSAERLSETLGSFTGDIEQVPPMYSAVKVDGKRLYELARQGEQVERKSRTVTIHEIELLEANLDKAHPEIRFRVCCSKGTYIRTLCTDIGKMLGYPAVMADLVRTSTGSITRRQCLTFERIEELQQSGKLQDELIPMDIAIRHLPRIQLTETQSVHALHGRKVMNVTRPEARASDVAQAQSAGSGRTSTMNARVYTHENKFIGVF